MNPFPRDYDPAREEQASLWAARLDGGELTEPQQTELDAWLAADPIHRVLLSAYCQFSADLEQQMPLLEGIRERETELRIKEETARPTPWWRQPALAGALLTAAAAVALLLWFGAPRHQAEDRATPQARRDTLELADGTRVELNARTRIHVELDRHERHVRLTEGEAFFSVSKDASRPFFVETPAGTVRVTGTRFDVRSDSPAALAVAVEEGSVQVRTGPDGSPPFSLRPGDVLTAGTEGVRVRAVDAKELADTLAWRRGEVVFAGTTLREALAQFARYHGRDFRATEAAGELRVGGRYSLDDVDGFLAAIAESLQLRITRETDGTVQVSLRSEH
jgi:transmembrane sensor